MTHKMTHIFVDLQINDQTLHLSQKNISNIEHKKLIFGKYIFEENIGEVGAV